MAPMCSGFILEQMSKPINAISSINPLLAFIIQDNPSRFLTFFAHLWKSYQQKGSTKKTAQNIFQASW